jgi:predicted RNA-binding protein Jag
MARVRQGHAMAGSVYEGKTFDEAVRKGLDALRLSRAEAVITTIEEGKGGFLGIGARPFRVSVARRPGGAIKEPAERTGGGAEEPRRGGRRGGREERPARGGERGGRGGREQAAQGRGGRDERGGRAGREENAGRGAERGNREERPPREKQPQAAAPVPAGREEQTGRDERGGREARGGREEQAGRDEKSGREARGGRGERRERAPREERRPEPAAAAAPSPVPPSVSADGGDESPRKRRRRGRRGGRGRRRGGAEGEGDEIRESHAPAVPMSGNGSEASHSQAVAEPVTAQVMRAPMAPQPAAPDQAPAMPAPEPAVTPMAYDPTAAPVTQEEAPHERRDPREHREGRGERSRSQRHSHHEGDESGEGSGAPDMNADELSATSKRLTEELLTKMGFEPKVSVRVDGNRVDVTVEVDRDDDLLNGRQGETRLSLQHLLNRFLNKGDGSRYHLQLEVNDFWQQREVELETLARKLADEAVAQNAEVVSDYLNSQERRILHVTLKEDSRVKTFSLGTGMVKRVAVAPAGFPERSEDELAS